MSIHTSFSFLFTFLFFATELVSSAKYYCDDSEECDGDTIVEDRVYCRGYLSCDNADISCNKACECNGLLGCHQATVNSTNGTIICDGEYGCKYGDIESSGGIWCDGQYGCKFSDMSTDGNIYCGGEFGCRLADLNSADYIYASGSESVTNSELKSFNRIYGYGNYALKDAEMDTDGITTVRAYFGGYMTTSGATFTCASGSTCYIYCYNDGCDSLTVENYGTTSITCDDDDCDTCPTENDYTSSLVSQDIKNEWTMKRQERLRKFRQFKNEQRELELKLDKELISQYREINGNFIASTFGINISNNNSDRAIFGSIIVILMISNVVGWYYYCKNNKSSQYQRL